MKKSKMAFLIVLLFALVSISTVCATDNFNETDDVQTVQTNTDEIITTDDHAAGEGYIEFDSNTPTVESGKQNEKNITGTLYYSEGEYIWQDVNVNCNYTDGNGVERSYPTTVKDSELNFDLSQCEGLIVSDTPYKLTFSPINDEYYDLFLTYNNNKKLADSYILLTVTEPSEPAHNLEIYVGTDGTDAEGFGIKGKPYKTIGYAVSQAQANDIIYISEGRYNEDSIVLNKTLTFIGLNRNVVIYSNKTAQGQKIFDDSAKGADSYKFVNLTFETVSFGSNSLIFNLQNTGINEITNCTFNDLTLRIVINSLASENIISNCNFNNVGINQAMTGAAVYLSGNSTITNTTFINSLNKATSSYVNLIQIAANTNLTVDNLTINGTSGKYNLFYINKETKTIIENSKIINNNINSQTTSMGGMLFSATGTNIVCNISQSLIANNTPQNGFFYGMSNTMTFNMNNNIIYNNTGKIMVNANPKYNVDYNYWGDNDIPNEVTINNWIIVETSHTPATVQDNEEFSVIATLKVNDTEGNINELERNIPEVPVTFEYNNQKVNKEIADKSTEAKFTFKKSTEDIIVTVINERITDKITEKELKIYVASNGTDADGYGLKDKPYKTIKYAVSKADSNYTIYVYEGRYDENLITITKDLAIIGENKNVFITSSVDNRKVFETLYNENGNNISIRFENLTFDTIKTGMYNAILNLRNEGKTEIINCIFENTDQQYNIWTSSKDTLIENCEFKNICFTSSGTLIHLTGKGNQRVINTTFNKITSTASGVVTLIDIINRPNNITVENLTVSEVVGAFYGIDMKNGGYGNINNSLTIKNSKFENNAFEKTNSGQGGSLFVTTSSSKLEIVNSTIVENNVDRGIFIGTSEESNINANYNLIYNNTGNILYSTGNPVKKYNMDYNYWGSDNPDLGDLNIHVIAIDKDLSEMKTIKNPIEPTMNVTVDETIYEGDNLTIEVTLNDNATGTIAITGIDGVEPQTLNSGKTTFTIEGLIANQYPITITYSGDYDYKTAEYEATITVKLPKSDVPDELKNVTINIAEGTTSPSFTINLPEDATGNFTVYVNGEPYTKELKNGAATITVDELPVGEYTISTEYSGDEKYAGFKTENETKTMPKATVPGGEDALKLTTPEGSATPSYSISLPEDATGNLTVTVDGKDTYTSPLNKGSATVDVPKLSPGQHNITVSYSGDEKFSGISKNETINVKQEESQTNTTTPQNGTQQTGTQTGTQSTTTTTAAQPAKTKIIAKKKTFKASKKVKKYTITLKAGKKPVKKVWVTIKIKKLTKKGKYKAVIKFKGNKNYKASSKKVKITIK